MGSYFGARLRLAGHDVLLVDPDRDHVDRIRERGLELRAGGRDVVVRPEVALSAGGAQADLVIVLTKAARLEAALAGSAALVGGARLVLVLPNGLGCGEIAANFVDGARLLHGVTAEGAVLDAPGVVRHAFPGRTYFGSFSGLPTGSEQAIGDVLTAAGLPADATADVESWIWTKLLVNVGYNAATALARVRNGQLASDPDGAAVLRLAVEEARAVARAKGIEIHYEDPVGFVIGLGLDGIGPNRSSMLQDVLRGRDTEIDFLNGAVVREGEACGVPTPVNEALWRLVRVAQGGS